MSATTNSTTPTNITTLQPSSIHTINLKSLGLHSDSLFFGLKFKPTTASLPGLLNKVRKKQKNMDIDISCILYDKQCNVCDLVWFKQLRNHSESVCHQGDSLNGKDRGAQALYDEPLDLEQIAIKLNKIPQNITHIAFVVSSYHNQPLPQLSAGYVHLSDDEGNQAFKLDLTTLGQDDQAIWVANLSRDVYGWSLTRQDLPLSSSDIPTIAKLISHELARALPWTQPSNQLQIEESP